MCSPEGRRMRLVMHRFDQPPTRDCIEQRKHVGLPRSRNMRSFNLTSLRSKANYARLPNLDDVQACIPWLDAARVKTQLVFQFRRRDVSAPEASAIQIRFVVERLDIFTGQ